MRCAAVGLLVSLLLAASLAQNPPVPAEQESFHSPMFRNERLLAVRVEIPPHQTTQVHRHVHQYLSVSLSDGTLTVSKEGQAPVQEKRWRGEARMGDPVAHSVRNDGDTPYRATVVDFFHRQGEAKPLQRQPATYCNPKSKTACVTERYLFCTERVCVSEVEMGPGALTMRHSHSTDHMVIAVSDLEMKDFIEGRPSATMRAQKSGEVLYIDAGVTHQLENGPKPARFITVSWK
jgi:quercetin dioxygenase-like cupin family protein